MGANAPIAIGTKGTVGSLIRKEIDCFLWLELNSPDTSKKFEFKKHVAGVSKGTCVLERRSKTTANTLPIVGSFFGLSWKRKRSSGSNNYGKYLPSMCSNVEVVSENKRFPGIPGYTYKSLKLDIV